MPLSQSERLARLRLIRSENVGPITFLKLLDRFGSAKDAIEALPDLAKRGGRKKPIKICARGTAVQEIEAAQAAGSRPLIFGDPDYPALLAAIDDPPVVLYTKGNETLLQGRSMAFVGARNASLNARKLAESMARDLGQFGFVITSGMARGLDAAAHRGALETGTIAVLAGGIDVVYPKENRSLYEEISERGLIVTEIAPGTVPQARHFPRRNRIISGLSEATIVVEATIKSGSLITARFAADQGREVFALPGSPLDPRAKGGNDLIRHGAHLCESAADVIQIMTDLSQPTISEPNRDRFSGRPTTKDEDVSESLRREVLSLLSPEPVDVDDLIVETGASTAAIAIILLELELAGRLERRPGNRVCLLTFDE